MPTRLRLLDFRMSRGPGAIGACQSDIARCAQFVNSAQARLVLAPEAGDEGWWGTFAEMAFSVSQTAPYLTCPREVARIEAMNICDRPVKVQNQFFDYLQYGNGRLPKTWSSRICGVRPRQVYTRNNVPTFVDLTKAPQMLRVYATDPADIGSRKRILLQGTDQADNVIYSQDGQVQVTGQWVIFESPFATAPMQFKTITGIQKDVTSGAVQLFQVDPATGDQVLLLTMEPGEMVANYRRYYLDSLPPDCCCGQDTAAKVTVTAIAKLELIPVVVDTDYLLIGNLEALIEECQSIRLGEMDSLGGQNMGRIHHKLAVGMLNSELYHYLGKNSPAVSFAPFGSAKLECVRVGMI